MINFKGNVCSSHNTVPLEKLGREVANCVSCGSTVRQRSIIQALNNELFGQSLSIDEISHRPDIHGIGMSCWHV